MKCFKFENPNETCTEWQYNRSEFQQTINTEVLNLRIDNMVVIVVKLFFY